jgi:hypothetical protein
MSYYVLLMTIYYNTLLYAPYRYQRDRCNVSEMVPTSDTACSDFVGLHMISH